MSRKILLLALSVALLPALGQAADETTVYRTKNADGTNSYSQVETTGSEARQLNSSDPVPATAGNAAAANDDGTAAAAGTPATREQQETRACQQARMNVDLLSSNQRLQQDNNGSLADLTDEQREQQLGAAQRQVDAYCNTQG